MGDRTKIPRKKAVTSTYSQPTLAQKSIQGFALSSFSPSQSIASSQSHDISRISLRPQAKLTVGQPGDIYEQEADNVAEQVMRMTVPGTLEFSSAQTAQNSLQRKCAACENEEIQEIQRKPTLQRAAQSNIQQPNNIESQLSATQGGGSPLPDNVRGFMEPRFGTDFSSVRVHTGSAAVQLSRNLSAQAFTYGSDIYFGTGKSPGNNNLMAHELTHVVQQTGGVQTKQLANQPTVQPLFEISSAPEIIQQREVCNDSGACWEEAEAAQTTSEQAYTPISQDTQPYTPAENYSAPEPNASYEPPAPEKASYTPEQSTDYSSTTNNSDTSNENGSGGAGGASNTELEAREGGAEGTSGTEHKPNEPASPDKSEESWWDRGIDWAEGKIAGGVHELASKAEGIPVLEQAANAGAWAIEQGSELTGGVLKGAGTMVGGIANMVAHPIDTAMGLEAMAEHVPMLPGIPNPLKAVHGLYDIAVNGKDVGEVANHVLNPVQSMKDDLEFGKKMVDGITKPYQQEIKEGKYAEAIGRGVFDIGSIVIGAGAGAGVKGAAVAGRGAAIVGEVADAARIAEGAAVASDAARIAEGAAVASDAVRVTEGAAVSSDAARTSSQVSDAAQVASVDEGSNAAKFARLKKDYEAAEKAGDAIESLQTTGQLPDNYVTKSVAQANGWEPGKALHNKLPNKQIGGDIFQNTPPVPGAEPLLPEASGRVWYEADVGLDSKMTRAKQPGTRLLYSNDGEIYITSDHYETARSFGRWK